MQSITQPRYNFVLHVKEVGNGLVETLSPEMVAGFGVYQLYVHPEAGATTLHRAFEYIADVQLASQLLNVQCFALERERGVACNDERAVDARQVRGQALGHAIREVLLLGIAADVCEGQHYDGQTRSRSRQRGGLMSACVQTNCIG